MTKKNFKLDQRVVIYNTNSELLDNKLGTILGKSSEHAEVDFYIVLLDEPLSTHKAINIIDSCLKEEEV